MPFMEPELLLHPQASSQGHLGEAGLGPGAPYWVEATLNLFQTAHFTSLGLLPSGSLCPKRLSLTQQLAGHRQEQSRVCL